MTHTTEKYGDIGNFFGVTYVILPFGNLKLVGTWVPTAKIIGDIPDFNVLNVPKTQPRHNPEIMFILPGMKDHLSNERLYNSDIAKHHLKCILNKIWLQPEELDEVVLRSRKLASMFNSYA